MYDKYVYMLNEDISNVKNLLGDRFVKLNQLYSMGIHVPQSFAVTSNACDKYYRNEEEEINIINIEILNAIKKLEDATGKKIKDDKTPLLLTIKPEIRGNIPDLAYTRLLNVGINDTILDKMCEKNEIASLKKYIYFIRDYSYIVKNIDTQRYDNILAKVENEANSGDNTPYNTKLRQVLATFKKIYLENTNEGFPEDPLKQIKNLVEAFYKQWYNGEACKYRKLNNITDNGVSLMFSEMIYSDMQQESIYGDIVSRNIETGSKQLFGNIQYNYLQESASIEKLQELNYDRLKECEEYVRKIENFYKDIQKITFIIEGKKLYILNSECTKINSSIAFKILTDMVEEKTISIKDAILNIDPKQFETLLYPQYFGKFVEGRIENTNNLKEIENINSVLEWIDRCKNIKIRANVNTKEEAKIARLIGAEGIGMCKTENMFIDKNRKAKIENLMFANTETEKALEEFYEIQKEDFIEIYMAMQGYPITIRLLDLSSCKLGDRGCRFLIENKKILETQIRAIIEAAIEVKQNHNINVFPEIMIPFVTNEKEVIYLKNEIGAIIKDIINAHDIDNIQYKIGTMIETPAACLNADRILKYVEFFSFGTDDLTMLTMGIDQEDENKFINKYLEKDIYLNNPLNIMDNNVRKLMKIAAKAGIKNRLDMKIGVCGNLAENPNNIEELSNIGISYISCSPYKVPIIKLALAQAKIKKDLIAHGR